MELFTPNTICNSFNPPTHPIQSVSYYKNNLITLVLHKVTPKTPNPTLFYIIQYNSVSVCSLQFEVFLLFPSHKNISSPSSIHLFFFACLVVSKSPSNK